MATKPALTSALSKHLDALHRSKPCPINNGISGRQSKKGFITSCLKHQAPKTGANAGKSKQYRKCDDCETGKVIKKFGIKTNLRLIELPRNLSIISAKEVAELRRNCNQRLGQFGSSHRYNRVNSMPAGRVQGV